MTTIKLTDGCLGCETLLVRCDLTQAASPIQADYGTGHGWTGTQYQCADARHRDSGLARIGQLLAGAATESRGGEGEECDWEVVEEAAV